MLSFKLKHKSTQKPISTIYDYTSDTFASLQQKIVPTIKKIADSHTILLHNIYKKEQQNTKMMNNPDYISSFTQTIDFELYVHKHVEDSSNCITIWDETKDGIQKFRIFVEQQICSVFL